MSVEDLVSTVEHTIRVCKTTAQTLKRKDVGLDADAALLTATARALEHALRNLSQAPDDTPQGIYLDELLQNLNSPYHWVTPALQKWIVRRLRKARTVVHKLLEELEIYGAKLSAVTLAQEWVKEVDEGPDLSSNTLAQPITPSTDEDKKP